MDSTLRTQRGEGDVAANPTMDMGFDELTAVTDRLAEAIALLEKRLSPVLRLTLEEKENSIGGLDETINLNAPLFQRLDELRRRLYNLGDRVHHMSDRAQL